MIGNLHGTAYPSARTRSATMLLHGGPVGESPDTVLLDDAAIDNFARLLTKAIETRTTQDGRTDMRDVAAHVLAEMRNHGTW